MHGIYLKIINNVKILCLLDLIRKANCIRLINFDKCEKRRNNFLLTLGVVLDTNPQKFGGWDICAFIQKERERSIFDVKAKLLNEMWSQNFSDKGNALCLMHLKARSSEFLLKNWTKQIQRPVQENFKFQSPKTPIFIVIGNSHLQI